MRRMTRLGPGFRAGLLVLGALLLAACGDEDGDPLGPIVSTTANQAAGSKLAALAIAIATGSEGAGPLDNFIGCSRRGIINYSNTPTGRQATVVGCNLGDSVVVDGSIEVRWTSTGGARTPISRIELVGPITVRVADTTRIVPSAIIENISFEGGNQPSLINARLHEVRVTLLGETIEPDRRARFEDVFGPFPLTFNSIPNAADSPAGLTEADARRLALQLGTTFLTILVNESGTEKPPHQYTIPCGVISVTHNPDGETSLVTFNLSGCDFGNGMLVGGSFAMNEAEADVSDTGGSLVVRGSLTVGGGVPRTTFSAFEWSTSFPDGLPSDAAVTMTLVTGQDRWEYTYTVPVDD